MRHMSSRLSADAAGSGQAECWYTWIEIESMMGCLRRAGRGGGQEQIDHEDHECKRNYNYSYVVGKYMCINFSMYVYLYLYIFNFHINKIKMCNCVLFGL